MYIYVYTYTHTHTHTHTYIISPDVAFTLFFIDVYDACQSGDLKKVKELLPDVIEVINQSKKYHMSFLMM